MIFHSWPDKRLAYAGMTGYFHPLIPCQALGQVFDSSPIKGEGLYGWFGIVVSPAPHLWIADQVRNDGLSARVRDSSVSLDIISLTGIGPRFLPGLVRRDAVPSDSSRSPATSM